MPDRYLVTHAITKDVKNEDLRDFLEESIEECFQILDNGMYNEWILSNTIFIHLIKMTSYFEIRHLSYKNYEIVLVTSTKTKEQWSIDRIRLLW